MPRLSDRYPGNERRYPNGNERGLEASEDAARLVVVSEAMQRLDMAIQRLAPSRATVLVRGEEGSGKSRVARALHQRSSRADSPFVTVDCSSIASQAFERILFGGYAHATIRKRGEPTGALHAADRGTLFLREILELPLSVQPRFLRLLDDGEPLEEEDRARRLDVRVLASTSEDIEAAVREGKFRRDLGDRISLVDLAVPPLRERLEDLFPLVMDVLREVAPDAEPPRLSAEALAALRAHPFPGNVRELRVRVLGAIGRARDPAMLERFDLGIP
jgi:DNA-binding NtrC family response regulator